MSARTPSPATLIALLWLCGLLAGGQYAKVSAVFPYFREVYPGLGPTLGFLVSALGLVGILFGLLSGVLIARLGYRRLLVGALLLGGAMSLFQASLPPFWLMLVSRFVEGASHLVIVVAAPTMIGQIAKPEHRATAMTLWSTVITAAFVLFAWGGQPFTQIAGLPALMAVHGVAMIAMALVLKPRLPSVGRNQNLAPLTLRAILARHISAYKNPAVLAPGAGWFFYATGFVAVVTVLPDYLPQDWRALLTGTLPLAALAVSLSLGVVMLRYQHPIRVLLIGFVAAALLALLFVTGLPRVLVAFAVLGAMGLVQAGSFAAIPAINTQAEDQALANGVLAQGGNLGNMVGTPMLLLMCEMMGFNGLVLFAVIFFSGGAAVHLWLARYRRDVM